MYYTPTFGVNAPRVYKDVEGEHYDEFSVTVLTCPRARDQIYIGVTGYSYGIYRAKGEILTDEGYSSDASSCGSSGTIEEVTR